MKIRDMDLSDFFFEKVFGFLMAGALAGFIGGFIIATYPGRLSKSKLYVDCIYNMRDRTIDQLEMMCAHLKDDK